MPTNRKICSDIVGYLKANNIDERIPYRLILSTLKDTANLLIKQDSDSRRLFKQANLWKPIPCLELEEIPLIDCPVDISCKTIKRSKDKLPEFYTATYGSLLKISNVDGSGSYTETTFEAYNDQINRRFKNSNISYFLIINNYLYVPDTTIEAVRVSGFFRDDAALICGNSCIKPLDLEFNCPDYLVTVVKQETQKQLLQRFRQIDEKPDNDTNSKA